MGVYSKNIKYRGFFEVIGNFRGLNEKAVDERFILALGLGHFGC